MASTEAASPTTPVSPINEKDAVVVSSSDERSVSGHSAEKGLSGLAGAEAFSPDARKAFPLKLCAKLDLHILTPMFFLNFLSLMGRTNIGAALIQKLPQDLHLGAMDVFLAISISAVMLMVAEAPSNLTMQWLEKKYGLAYMRYLSLITVGLGVVTLGQAFDQTYGALLATRFLVGLFDAGLIPGCVFVISQYYPGVHMQWRMSMLMVANIISNIVSNLLAYGIAQIQSSNGYHGWRWIFIVEGCMTIAIGLICVWSNISRPETAAFLTEEEKETIALHVESRESTIGLAAEWVKFLTNGLNYVWAALYVFTCATTYSVAIFAPSFVQAFHPTYTVPQVQGQVIPIFVVSAAAALIAAWLADRFNHRSGFAIAGYVFTIIGYAILRVSEKFSSEILMLGLYFVSIGTYVALPMVWSLTCLNLATPFQKSLGTGFVVGIGNVGAFISAWIFRSSEGPRYAAGMTDGLIITCVALGLTALAWGYIEWHNSRAEHEESSNDSLVTGVVYKYRS